MLNMQFGLVVLTEMNPTYSDAEAIEEWNQLLDAACPMLDVTDTVVICITSRTFDTDSLNAPDKVHLVDSPEEVIRLVPEAIPA
jgi:hypothetical protein